MSVADEIRLAWRFELGDGLPKDPLQAAYWFRKAADHGDPGAQNQLGYLYFLGLGVERDARLAARWFTRAMGGGSQEAKLNFAVLHLGGIGVARDPGFARDLLLQLAKKRVSQAELYLGILYFHGLGTARNRNVAEQWFRKAAEHKNPEGQFVMGTLYSSSPDHEHDFRKAAGFLRRSARAGYPPAMQALGVLLIEHPELKQKRDQGGVAMIIRAAEKGFWRGSATLGIMARDGRSDPPNLSKAFQWFTIALRQGGRQAAQFLKTDLSHCRLLLTADEQTRSSLAAEAWLLSHPSSETQQTFNSASPLLPDESDLPQ